MEKGTDILQELEEEELEVNTNHQPSTHNESRLNIQLI